MYVKEFFVEEGLVASQAVNRPGMAPVNMLPTTMSVTTTSSGGNGPYFTRCTVTHPGPTQDRSSLNRCGLRLKKGQANLLVSVPSVLSIFALDRCLPSSSSSESPSAPRSAALLPLPVRLPDAAVGALVRRTVLSSFRDDDVDTVGLVSFDEEDAAPACCLRVDARSSKK